MSASNVTTSYILQQAVKESREHLSEEFLHHDFRGVDCIGGVVKGEANRIAPEIDPDS